MARRVAALALALALILAGLPTAAAAEEVTPHQPTQLYVNAAWSGTQPDEDPDGAGPATKFGVNAFASLADAVKAAQDGDTINVYPGEYGLTADPTWNAGGQSGWYLPITQNNLTIQGVDENGKPYDTKPNRDSALPLIYGADFTPNGVWASQNLITVFGDNVTIRGLHIMPKAAPNKTIELVGADPTVEYCLFTPTDKQDVSNISGVDFTHYGGSLYISGGALVSSNATITDNYFFETCVAFDSAKYQGTNYIARNTFDSPAYYESDNQPIYVYMIGNVTWADPPVTEFSGALVEDNDFVHYADVEGYAVIKNRLNGVFTLQGNFMEGDDETAIAIDTARYGCTDGAVIVKNYRDDKGDMVDDPFTVTANGVRYQNIWVDDDWAYSENGTLVEVPGGTRHIGVDAFASIQAALDAADPGATVSVMDGVYLENLKIRKPVTLRAYGQDAVIQLQGVGYDSCIKVDDTKGSVVIDGFVIKGTSEATVDYGSNCIYVRGTNTTVTVSDCMIWVGASASSQSPNKYEFGHGIVAEWGSTGELTISGNNFNALQSAIDSGRAPRKAVHINPSISRLTLIDNTLNEGFTAEGFTSQAETSIISRNTIHGGNIRNGICLNGGSGLAVKNADVSNNTIENAVTAIWLRSAEGVHVSDNSLANCDYGIVAQRYKEGVDYKAESIVIRNMDLSGCTTGVVNADDDGTVDAAENFWGTSGPAGKSSGKVETYPYYTDEAMTRLLSRYDGIAVDDDWRELPNGTHVTLGDAYVTIGVNAFASLAEAVKAAQDGATINVYPGEYGLTADANWVVEGQGGWYLPIVQDNLTIRGVDEDGKPYDAKPNRDSALPIVYGADYTPNGAWASQNLVTVFGDNVTITGLHFMPKVEVNKTVELVGANPTVKYCLFTPNTEYSGDEDVTSDGGALYVNGSRISAGETSNVEFADNYFYKCCVVFDSVRYNGNNHVVGNTFDTPWSYEDNGTTVYGYMIGNVTWANPPVKEFSGALIEGNTFINYPTTGYYLIKNRLNGRFTLVANRMGGRDGASLIQIDTTRFGCEDASALIKSWVTSSGSLVATNILVDASGIHYPPAPPSEPPITPPTPPVQPPIVAGSTSETVTPAGGVINHEDVVALTFPADAVAVNTTVTIAPMVDNVPPTGSMNRIGTHIYDIVAETEAGDSVERFGTPVTVTVTLTDDELGQIHASAIAPRLFYRDANLKCWIPVPTVLKDKTLSATTDRPGTYAALLDASLPNLTDIGGHWAEPYILKIVGLRVASGQPDGTFAPDVALTRAQAAKMLALALGIAPDDTVALPFADKAQIPSWATGYVAAVYKSGLMQGYPNNCFDPNGTVTRAQFAMMVVRALGLTVEAGSRTTFADDGSIPTWARAEVAAAVKAGVVSGLPGNQFAAARGCTRAEAAKMLCKLIDLLHD